MSKSSNTTKQARHRGRLIFFRRLQTEALEERAMLAVATQLLADINVVPFGPEAGSLVSVGPISFFSARDPVFGTELWKSDGTADGTVLVKDIRSVANFSSDPRNLVNVNGTLFFSANDGINGTELWKS